MKIGYARVSTQDQSTNMQLDALRAAGCERIFSEKASGAKTDRPELLKALEYARSGDVIVVWKLDRLARSMRQLVETMEMLRERGIAKKVSDTITGTVLNFAIDEIQKVKVRKRSNSAREAKMPNTSAGVCPFSPGSTRKESCHVWSLGRHCYSCAVGFRPFGFQERA